MDFRLLGPLEITIMEDKLLELGSARERTILASLLLHANHAVQIEHLIDAVWDDSPPATARSQVQQCVSALRRKLALAGDLLKTESAGYAIRVPDSAIDVARFAALTRRSRTAAAESRLADAADDLRAALGIWRGPACAGIESAVIRAAATRLDEDRLGALETCLDLELRLGRHRELSGELGELVGEYPLRERLVALYMLALYRSGRKVAALDVFRSARMTLVEELGLEPGDELSALHRAILAGDQALDVSADTVVSGARIRAAAVPVPRQLPSAIGDFTGRDREVGSLRDWLSVTDADAIERRYLPVAILRGKGGVGKTALALHAAHALRQHYPDGQLYAQLRDSEGQPVFAGDVLAWFLRALGLQSAALPAGLTERAAAYRSMLGERRVLIVLDDAYSSSQVLPLIPGNPGCGVIVTSRDALSGLHGSRYLDVGDLDEAASLRLLESVIGDRRVANEASSALILIRQCGCLPLALRIVAAKLAARPDWRLGEMVRRLADEEKRLDELVLGDTGIRATVAMSYNGLNPDARQLFRLLGLLGASDFGSWTAVPLLGGDAMRAMMLFDTLVDARLVDVQVSSGQARFRLHELVRVYARERLAAEETPSRRAAALERMLGCWLGLAEKAHQRAYGGDYAILHGTAIRFPMPPGIVDELLASPLSWLRAEQRGLMSAVHQAAQAGLDELCWDLALTLVTLFESDYQATNWRWSHEAALEAVRRAGNRFGEGAMLFSLGNLAIAEQPARAASYLESASEIFEEIGQAHGHALAVAGLAFIDRLNGRYDQALARYVRCLGVFRRAADRVSEVDTMTSMAQIHTDRQQFDDARRLLNEALAACETLTASRILAQTEYRMGSLMLRTGELAKAERHLRASLHMARDEGDVVGELYALHSLAAVHARQQRRAIAEAEFCAAMDLSRQSGERIVRGRVLLAFAEAQYAWGDLDQGAALAGEAIAVFSAIDGASVLRAQAVSLRARGADIQ